MVQPYTDAQIAQFKAFYEEHGVVRLPGLIDPDWVAKIQNAIDEAMKRVDEPRSPTEALSYGTAPGRMTIRHMWRENPVVRAFMLRSDLAEPIARIVGAQTLRFWFDLTFIHDGSPDGEAGVGTGWHHDIAAFGFKGEQLPSLWMAMSPATAERSRLMFIDKSHKTVPGFFRPPGMPDTINGRPDGMLEIPDYDTIVAQGGEEVVTWDCEAGDAIIIHPFTIHAASGNVPGSGGRRAITTRWFGDDVRYYPTNGSLAPLVPGVPDYFLPVGARPEGEYFPLVYSAQPDLADAT